jgi:hypothetical protein
MTTFRTSLRKRTACGAFTALFLALAALLLSPVDLAAQGQPVKNGSMLPVSLWGIGTIVLGLALAYGILRTRRRSRAKKELTEQATKHLYADEERARVRSDSV